VLLILMARLAKLPAQRQVKITKMLPKVEAASYKEGA
jgi:hypothetical protein